MRACDSISKIALFSLLALSLAAPGCFVSRAWAEEPPPPAAPGGAGPENGGGAAHPEKAEEDDYKSTPYTNFGVFSSSEDEDEDTKFFQFGRFFGVSLGTGYSGAFGNRGLLIGSAFPNVDLRVHYWFDFNWALTLGIYTANFGFNADPGGGGSVEEFDYSLFLFGLTLRYYFDTQNAVAPVAFANPYLSLGFGSYTRTQTPTARPEEADKESSFGLNLGAGLEFTVKPKKTYFNLEGRIHSVHFNDDGDQVALPTGSSLPDRNGLFFSVTGSVLFTW